MTTRTSRARSPGTRPLSLCARGLLALLIAVPALTGVRFLPIEDFDDGQIVLASWPGEDADPTAWLLDPLQGHNGSPYALRLTGNTWKTESIDPRPLDSTHRWSVAVKVTQTGELQGLGIADSAHALFFAFAGSEEADPEIWVTVFQGARPTGTWNTYTLPIADEWLSRYGYLPVITRLVFVNDRDSDPSAEVLFDDVLDVTEDQPHAPSVAVTYTIGGVRNNGRGTESVEVQFQSTVTDPDGGPHSYLWRFGDGSSSTLPDPAHTYLVQDDHHYNVLLEVADSTNRWGRASCTVTVDSGPGSLPIVMNFVGDVMLARGYEAPGGIIPTQGVEAIFAPTRPYLGDAADLTVANLECPLTQSGTPHPTKPIVFRGSPANAAGLAFAGIDVVTIANNHILDYGAAGIEDTRTALAERGIAFSGAGADVVEAERPLFVAHSGLSIAFLAASDRTGQYNNYQPYLNAGEGKPGFAELTPFRLRRSITQVRDLADAVIVEMHSGSEYSTAPDAEGDAFRPMPFPSAADRSMRRAAIDDGADLVIAHHPHILQGVEVHSGRLIAHSLGNFAFDLGYSETYPTAILSGRLGPGGFSGFRLLPVYIDHWIPRRAAGELGRHVLEDLAMKSRALGTVLLIDTDSIHADVALDTTVLIPRDRVRTASAALRQEASAWISAPVPLSVPGSLRQITGLLPSGTWSYRLGRDIVWFGSWEEEGAGAWALEENDERTDSTVSRTGARSLRQRRTAGSPEIITRLEQRVAAGAGATDYTAYGWIKGANARNARLRAGLYTARSGGGETGAAEPPAAVQGTGTWTFVYGNTPAPVSASFADLELRSSGPTLGTGEAWFDDAGVIAWSPWSTWNSTEVFPVPTDVRWIQVRRSAAATDVQVTFVERTFTDHMAQAHLDVALQEGWNLISNPLALPESLSLVQALFPSAASGTAYGFSTAGGYQPAQTLHGGSGYWAKFPAALVQRLDGPPSYMDTVHVTGGWNIIGSVSTAVETSAVLSVPPGLRTSLFYGYAPGYFPAEQILPGSACWVKTAADGILILQGSAPAGRAARSRTATAGDPGTLTFRDAAGETRTLYFTTSAGNVPGGTGMYEMPPPPPGGVPDVRFADGRILAVPERDNAEHPILSSGLLYPVTLSWEHTGDAEVRIVSPAHDEPLGRRGSLVLHRDPGPMRLVLSRAAEPGATSLGGFYPNPFNAETIAEVRVGTPSQVHAVLFDILGRRVETLLDGPVEPGTFPLRVAGTALASGVYFCRVTAAPLNGRTGFTAVRKLLLLR